MSTFADIAGSGAGLVIIGAAWVLLRFLHHAPARTHPWLYRAAIAGMYLGGCTIVLTALGGYAVGAEMWIVHWLGGTTTGLGHAGAVLAGLLLAVTVIVGLIYVPDTQTAYIALALPFVLALAGGHLHDLLTVVPGPAIAAGFSSWLGG